MQRTILLLVAFALAFPVLGDEKVKDSLGPHFFNNFNTVRGATSQFRSAVLDSLSSEIMGDELGLTTRQRKKLSSISLKEVDSLDIKKELGVSDLGTADPNKVRDLADKLKAKSARLGREKTAAAVAVLSDRQLIRYRQIQFQRTMMQNPKYGFKRLAFAAPVDEHEIEDFVERMDVARSVLDKEVRKLRFAAYAKAVEEACGQEKAQQLIGEPFGDYLDGVEFRNERPGAIRSRR